MSIPAERGGLVKLQPLPDLALEGVEWPASRFGCFTPEKDTVPYVQEAGWGSSPVWITRKTSPPAEFDPQTVQFLCRLCHTGQ